MTNVTAAATIDIRRAPRRPGDGVVEDDGAGFDPTQAQRHDHFGLLGMKERAEALGGKSRSQTPRGRRSSWRWASASSSRTTPSLGPPAPALCGHRSRRRRRGGERRGRCSWPPSSIRTSDPVDITMPQESGARIGRSRLKEVHPASRCSSSPCTQTRRRRTRRCAPSRGLRDQAGRRDEILQAIHAAMARLCGPPP